ncbi:MAG: CDP-alcohol phosphatidyltransferase family protein [Blastocatellia bacterium]
MLAPNLITLFRLCLVFVSVGLFGHGARASAAALVLLVITIWLDALDGYVARRYACASDTGAAFDIAADRIVENVYWIFFAVSGLISFWIPLIVIARGGLTDFLRALAFRQGQNAFGENTMMRTWWGRLLTGSRWSRAAYGVIKCAAFFALGARLALKDILREFPAWRELWTAGVLGGLQAVALALAVAAVACCLVRGVPVMIEGLRFFRKAPVMGLR